LVFKIKEGIEKVIRKVRFLGNYELSDSELESVVRASPYSWWISWATGSGVVKKEELENDAKILQHLYLTRGYADIRVSTPQIKDIDEGLEIVFSLDEGEQYSFGDISASGDLLDGSMESTLKGVKASQDGTFNVDLV